MSDVSYKHILRVMNYIQSPVFDENFRKQVSSDIAKQKAKKFHNKRQKQYDNEIKKLNEFKQYISNEQYAEILARINAKFGK